MDSMKLNFAESLMIPCVSEGFLDPAGSEAGNGKKVSKKVKQSNYLLFKNPVCTNPAKSETRESETLECQKPREFKNPAN